MDLNRDESRPFIVDWLIADMLADALKPVPGRATAAKAVHVTRLRRAVARVWNKAASRRKWWS